MAKRKRTEEEKQRSRAEGVAKRRNSESEAKAPLLAWAGLTKTVTADDVLDRRLKIQIQTFWDSVAMLEREAAWSAKADWHRFVVWSLVEPAVYEQVAAWADHVRGPVYCRLSAWREASERAGAGLNPMPSKATMSPSGCWPDLRLAINAGTFKQVAQQHRDAGCTHESCKVTGLDAPLPFRMTTWAFVAEDGSTFNDWERREVAILQARRQESGAMTDGW